MPNSTIKYPLNDAPHTSPPLVNPHRRGTPPLPVHLQIGWASTPQAPRAEEMAATSPLKPPQLAVPPSPAARVLAGQGETKEGLSEVIHYSELHTTDGDRVWGPPSREWERGRIFSRPHCSLRACPPPPCGKPFPLAPIESSEAVVVAEEEHECMPGARSSPCSSTCSVNPNRMYAYPPWLR